MDALLLLVEEIRLQALLLLMALMLRWLFGKQVAGLDSEWAVMW